MAGDVVCDCWDCWCGAPGKFKLSVSGIQPAQDDPCPDCADLDGDYILEHNDVDPCKWNWFGGEECGSFAWLMEISLDTSDCTLVLRVDNDPFGAQYKKVGRFSCLYGTHTLTRYGYQGNHVCELPSTITLEAIGIDSLAGTDCLVGPRCPEPTNIPLPEISPAFCGLDMACACAVCAGQGEPGSMGIPWPAGGAGGCGGDPAGDAALNVNNGNLSVRLGMPAAGALAPVEALTFHSRGGGPSAMGYGVHNVFAAQVLSTTNACHALLIRCDGSRYCFSCKNPADGTYAHIPPGAPSVLRKTDDGWEETEPPPHGKKYTYDSQGRLAAITGPSGRVWTMTYGSSLSSILDPAGRRTSYIYDGSGQIQRIVDVHGRSTTYVVDGHGNLTQRISPEWCITELVYGTGYDDLHQLKALVAPDGARTSFSYDDHGWCRGIQQADGTRHTYSYLDWDTTEITDPAGKVTTVIHDGSPSRNIAAVIDALGQRTTQTWEHGYTMSVQQPDGKRTTYSYATLSSGLKSVESVENGAGRLTYVYDQQDLVEARVDALGRRTTNVWDEQRRLIAVENPLGARTSYLYDDQMCPMATIDPLGQRTTLSFDAHGEVRAEMDGLGHRTTYSYENGQRVAVQNPLGAVTTTVRDLSNRVLAEVNALGERTSQTYDLSGRPEATIDPLGQRTTAVYDLVGRRIASIDPLGHRSSQTYDPRGNPLETIDPLGNIRTSVYDALRRPVATLDPLGNRTTTVYDRGGRPAATIDPLGARSTRVYDAGNRVIATIDPLGQRSTSVYDAVGNQVASINPLGHVATTVYDEADRPVATVDPLGHTNSTVYDAAGRTEATVDPLGRRTSFVHDAAGRPAAAIDPLGQRTTTLYDAAGRTSATVDALGSRTTLSYDAAGRPTEVTDPLGHTSSTVYDPAGRVRATIDPLGHRTTPTYDAAGRQVAVTNALGHTSTQVYDSAGRTAALIDPLGYRTTPTYDAAGRQVAVTNALGHTSTQVYDPAGRTAALIDPLGYRTSSTHDAAGRRIAQITPLGHATTQVYDAASRTVATIDPLGHRTTLTHDGAGRPIATTDANGNMSTTVYDEAGQAMARVNALGHRTTTVHDPAGRPIAVVDAHGGRNTYTHDAVGRIVEQLDPLGRATTFAYDAAGRQTSILDARGIRGTWQYDAASRLTSRVSTRDAPVTFAYDAVGNRTEIRDGTGLWTFTYEAANRRQTATDPAGNAITYGYDAIGQRTGMIAPDGGRFTYVYDPRGAMDHLVNPQGDRTTFSYDAAGRRTLKELADGSRASYTYDAASQVAQVYNLRSDDSVIAGFVYDYDPAGNRTGVLESGGDRVTWTYDATNQLTREQRSGDWAYDHTYAYDALGNRLVKEASGALTTYAYDLANQLTTSQDAAGTTTYAYDLAGNLHIVKQPTGQRTTTTWDDQSRQIGVLLPDGSAVTNTFRFDGLRYSKQESQATTKFLWDFNNYLAETNAADEIQAVYTNEPQQYGNLISQYRKGPTLWLPSYYHYDALGSARVLTGEAGDVTDTYLYDAWGNELAVSGSTHNPFRWVGQVGYYWDEGLGTFYIRARVYEPVIGRWMSQDPRGVLAHRRFAWLLTKAYGPELFQLSLYAYGLRSPALRIDPSGLDALLDLPSLDIMDLPPECNKTNENKTYGEVLDTKFSPGPESPETYKFAFDVMTVLLMVAELEKILPSQPGGENVAWELLANQAIRALTEVYGPESHVAAELNQLRDFWSQMRLGGGMASLWSTVQCKRCLCRKPSAWLPGWSFFYNKPRWDWWNEGPPQQIKCDIMKTEWYKGIGSLPVFPDQSTFALDVHSLRAGQYEKLVEQCVLQAGQVCAAEVHSKK